MKTVKRIFVDWEKWVWLYPIIAIVIWHYIQVLIFSNFERYFIGFFEDFDLFVYGFATSSLIVAAVVSLVANHIAPQSTTWRLSFGFALPCSCFYLLYEGIWPIVYGNVVIGHREWVMFAIYNFLRWWLPTAVVSLPVLAASGRLGAYLGSKAMSGIKAHK